VKADIHSTIKLYLRKQEVGRICPLDMVSDPCSRTILDYNPYLQIYFMSQSSTDTGMYVCVYRTETEVVFLKKPESYPSFTSCDALRDFLFFLLILCFLMLLATHELDFMIC
jgi:hypothetical protein